MAGEALAAGTAAVLGTALAVVATGYVMWNSTAAERTKFRTQIEELSAKADKTSAAVAELATAVSTRAPAPAASTPAPALGNIEGSLAKLSAKLDSTDKNLAALATKIDASDKALADIKSASGSVGDLKTATAAQGQALQQISASLDGIRSATEAQKAAIASLSTPTSTVPKDSSQAETAKAPAERELIVVYVPQSSARPNAAPPALSVRFDRTAGTNATTQTQKLAADLKTMVSSRKDCVITVAGYADTLGDDAVNLAVSRERAQIVAKELRTALPGVEIKEVAWGERSLAVWTPDNKVEMANRRVDINVECKG